MAEEIILVTGGQRSGKSMFAEQLVSKMTDTPVYLATAEARDDEFRDRIRRHQARRGSNWTTVETQLNLHEHDFYKRCVLIDCATMLSTNYFFANGEDLTKSLEAIKDDFEQLLSQKATFVIVTNEIGLGGISANTLQRRFTDLMGFVNKFLAEKADAVYFMVSGLPMKIK